MSSRRCLHAAIIKSKKIKTKKCLDIPFLFSSMYSEEKIEHAQTDDHTKQVADCANPTQYQPSNIHTHFTTDANSAKKIILLFFITP